MDIRVGLGIDIHKFGSNRKLVLGGVHIPYELGLIGHSDADAVSHAVIDALLGAASLGDIGQYFPDTDPAWKDSDSILLLKNAWAKISTSGWIIQNIDCAILLEKPKIAPYIEEMKMNLSQALGISQDQIGIKATTAETLGFVGRKEGILAQAVALIAR